MYAIRSYYAVKTLRKLKDGQGQYLWQPSVREGAPDTLLGKPLYTVITSYSIHYTKLYETDRKKLVGAISEILNTPTNYLGAPTFAYEIGNYTIDKNGLVTVITSYSIHYTKLYETAII